jgi:hypothetical protein
MGSQIPDWKAPYMSRLQTSQVMSFQLRKSYKEDRGWGYGSVIQHLITVRGPRFKPHCLRNTHLKAKFKIIGWTKRRVKKERLFRNYRSSVPPMQGLDKHWADSRAYILCSRLGGDLTNVPMILQSPAISHRYRTHSTQKMPHSLERIN